MSNIFETNDNRKRNSNNNGFGSSTTTPSWSSNPVQSPPLTDLTKNNSMGGGGGGSSISFAKQPMTTNFSPSGGAGTSMGIPGTSSNPNLMSFGSSNHGSHSNNAFTTNTTPTGAGRDPYSSSTTNTPSFGFNNIASMNTNTTPSNVGMSGMGAGLGLGQNTVSFDTTATATSNSNRFVSTGFSTPTATFQPNSLLTRPSPSPTSSFMNQNPQGVGLRRRGGVGVGTNVNHSNTLTNSNRPPLPSMTRLGVSTDAPDDFKENSYGQGGMNKNESVTTNTTTDKKNDSVILEQPIKKKLPQSSLSKMNGLFSATNYSSWVIIYGFTNSLEYNTILSNFEGYGMIVDKYPSTLSNKDSSGSSETASGYSTGSSNWVCVQYKSSLQADKALCQHGSLVHIVDGGNNGVNSSSSGGTAQDTIVIIGVMQMDESLAMKLGLKNYLEMGSTGFERKSAIGSATGIYSKDDDDDDKSRSERKNTRFPSSSIMNEDDILLLGDNSKSKRGIKQRGQGYVSGSSNENRQRGGVCEKILSWFFSW